MSSLYQLIGPKNLKPGQTVDMGPGGHRYGRIQAVVKEDYVLPNPCMVTGQVKFFQQPVNLYLIRGIDNPQKTLIPVGYVWGFTA